MTILLTILLIISTITSIYYFTKHPYHRRFWLSLTFLLVAIIGLGTTNTLINAASASKTKVQHVSKKEGQRAKQEAHISSQEAATESSVQSTATVDTTQTTTNQAEEMVTVAPTAGKKYHLDANCRGLKRATSTTTMTLADAQAQAQGYTLCGWED